MKILALDTTTDFLCLGLSEGEKACEYRLQAGKRMSLLIARTIERALSALGWNMRDIDYFACGLGPGSFTGVRMGLASIKAIAWSLKKPVVGIPTLDTIARGAGSREGVVFSAVDAKRGLIYCSAYKKTGAGYKKIMPYKLLTPDEFLKKLKYGSLVAGDALTPYKEDILRKARGIRLAEREYWYPRPGSMIAIAKEMIREKKYADAFEALPIYLYPKDCQIRKTK